MVAALAHEPPKTIELVNGNEVERVGIAGIFQWLRVDELEIDSRYQRALVPAHVRRIAKTFNPGDFGVLFVSARDDGRYYVVDGQHRLAALQQLGWNDHRVPCMVYRGLGVEGEARLFVNPQTSRKYLTPANVFKAKLLANDAGALGTKSIVESAGFSINLQDGNTEGGRIAAIGTISNIYRINDGEDLKAVLELARDAWGSDTSGLQGHLLGGMGRFVGRYRGEYDRRRLIASMQAITPMRLMAKAVDQKAVVGGNNDTAVGRALLQIYNNNLRARRLPSWDRE